MIPKNEYNPYYRSYIEPLASGGKTIIENLIQNKKDLVDSLSSIPIDKHEYRYAEDKWTIKDIVQHIIDAERVFSYRAMRFARNDQTPLPGFEQDDYVEIFDANQRDLNDLIEEFSVLRNATIAMYKSFDDKSLKRIGTASNSPMSVRALGYLFSGHVNHHLKVIQERYL